MIRNFFRRHAESALAAALVLALVLVAVHIDPTLGAAAGVAGLTVNKGNLDIVFTGFRTSFQKGLTQAAPMWQAVATEVPSATAKEKYGWLGDLPGLREWIGPRVIHNLAAHDYEIKNRKFEYTVGVDVDDIEDDTYGVYAARFELMGRAVAAHPDQLVWPLLAAGFATPCYDGQFFFDTDHPVLDANGNPISVANTDGGAGTAWFLFDNTQPFKPILYQLRKPFVLRVRDREEDENVWSEDKILYGGKKRCNVGFAFWQTTWGSKQALSKTTYRLARESLMAMKGDYGRPLGIMPNTLIVPPALEGEALEILNAERDAAGATNVYKGTAKVKVVPWLA
jgi:phage major head subunit gpT-like protein